MFADGIICNMIFRYFPVSAEIWKQDLGGIIGTTQFHSINVHTAEPC